MRPLTSGVGGRLDRWRIEDREYARHEERRGRRYAFETLEPGRTALVVIDMVPFFVAEGSHCRGIGPDITRLAGVLRAVCLSRTPRLPRGLVPQGRRTVKL